MVNVLPNGPWIEYKENALAINETKILGLNQTVIHPRVIKVDHGPMMQKTLRSSARVASSLKLAKKEIRRYQKVFWWNTIPTFIDLDLVSPKVTTFKKRSKKTSFLADCFG